MFYDIDNAAPVASLESSMLYEMFYRLHGMRRAVQLVSPPLSKTASLEMPRASVLHYVADDESQYGIMQDDPILRNQTRLVMVEHLQALSDNKGPPRPMFIPPGGMIRDYHRANRNTRQLLRPEITFRDPMTLVVENYALLPHLFRYTNSVFASYYKWWNIQATMWERVGQLTAMTDREQYLVCTLPTLLPPKELLNRGATGGMTRQVLEKLRDPKSWLILEIWKWLGEQRADSVLSRSTPAQLAKMNLIWMESGKWFVVNLGVLDQWRAPGKAEVAAGSEARPGLAPVQMQIRFLRALMVLSEARSAEVSPVTQVEEVLNGQTPEPTTEPTVAVTAQPITIKYEDAEGKTRQVKLTSNLDIDKLPEHAAEETEENHRLIDDTINADLDALEKFYNDQIDRDLAVADENEDAQTGEPKELRDPDMVGLSTVRYVPQERSLEKSFMDKVEPLLADGLVSGAEYRRYLAISEQYKALPNPFGLGTLAEHAVVTTEELKISTTPQIPDNPSVPDKSMLASTLFDFDSKYIDKVMSKDLASMLLNLQHAGVAVTNYSVEVFEDATGKFQQHRLQLTQVRGKPTTVEFRLPVVDTNGTFRSNGVRYRLRKQRSDVPIRKVSPSKVALTSYYSKLFVLRSEKQANNYPGWLTNQIAARGMDDADLSVVALMVSRVLDTNVRTPRIYSIMAERFRSFFIEDCEFFFDYHARETHFGADKVAEAESSGMLVIGKRANRLLVVDYNNMIYRVDGEKLEIVGTFESLLGISGRGPAEMVEIKVFNKLIPAGVFLAYHLGLAQLMELLKVTPRRVPAGERLHLAEDEYALRFSDESLIFQQDSRAATLILSGFQEFDKWIRNYPVALFDRKDIYLNILEHEKVGMRYLREMDLMVDLFVDPITAEILKEMGEPQDFIGLIFRACELLETDWAPDETDMAYQRIRGYERMAGTVYSELVKSIRMHRSRGVANAKIELAPYAIWQSIHQDPAVKVVEESNPIHNVKEAEELTYTGVGGRSERSMVKRTRVFHQNDMAVISEATKDSGQVGITTFLTANPKLTGLRGLTAPYNAEVDGPTSLLSTSALLSPCADRDDPKRVNFISIQKSSNTFAKGYQATPLRTGYEQILAHRTDEMFAHTAKQAGKVVSVTDKAIAVEYEDGTRRAFELGRVYGTVASLTLPHELLTTLKEGDSFANGDLIVYNKHYFDVDPLNPTSAVWKAGVLVKTAILESTDTLEDSSAISERIAALMATYSTTVRNISVTFGQSIHNLVRVGDEVDLESILCTIEEAETADSGLFDDESRGTLRFLAANTPRSKVKGVVEKIEVFYHGDLDDMSESLQAHAMVSDRQRRRLAKELQRTFTSGKVDDAMRVEGNPLMPDNAVIKVYITEEVPAGVGDKGVFGLQLKTIFGRIMSGVNETESGTLVDAIFGYLSISNRIVRSPELMGTTNTLLRLITKRAVAAYRSGS